MKACAVASSLVTARPLLSCLLLIMRLRKEPGCTPRAFFRASPAAGAAPGSAMLFAAAVVPGTESRMVSELQYKGSFYAGMGAITHGLQKKGGASRHHALP